LDIGSDPAVSSHNKIIENSIVEKGLDFRTYTATVKAPNFDRIFKKNIFTPFFVRCPPLKKIDRVCKIKVFVVPQLNFYSEIHRVAERFPEGGEVIIWAANFDRYK
jgi:hypothetical protein